MKLKVKHEELNSVADVMTKDGDSYDVQIDKILSEIEKLRAVWIGYDAEEFCDNFERYMKKMKNIPIALRVLAKLTKSADKGYVEKDESFSKELRTEVGKYDEPNYD